MKTDKQFVILVSFTLGFKWRLDGAQRVKRSQINYLFEDERL